jgi:hypothetical protein
MILDIIEYGKIRQEIIKTINDYSINKSYISACWL